jgi:hypothetical protein
MSVPNPATRLPRGLILLAIGAALGLFAGTALSALPIGTPASGAIASPTATAQPVHYQGSFDLQPSHGVAGTTVRATGSGFAPNAQLTIAWNSVDGSWVLSGSSNESFAGRSFEPTTQPLTQATADASGAFTASFVVPDGFGFSHDVTVQGGQTVVNKAAFKVDPQASISPASGPPGTPIHLVMHGVGWANLENSWQVTYDNAFTGWLSAVTTDGLAEAVIPATGAVGEHIIRVVHGAFSVPYLNNQQSPEPDRPTFVLKFLLTPGDPVLPAAADSQSLPTTAGQGPDGSGPRIWTDLQAAPVGTPDVVHGAGFPAGASIDLTWSTVVGNRVAASGYEEQDEPMGSVTADADGTFRFSLAMPDDLGGAHHIDARVGNTTLASTSVTITPSAFAIEPAAGPAGTTITLHLKGVGWTETANIYTLVYDNGYLGYACGFNSQGDVVVHLPAAGTPGWHFIDLYPAIYKGKDISGLFDYRIPQLTYAADHPGERLPAFHFAFRVTG